MNELSQRVARLERHLRLFRVLAVVGFSLSTLLAIWIGASFRKPLRVSNVVVTSADGAQTIIEGGRIRMAGHGGNRITLQVDEQTSTVALATHGRDAVAPEMVLRVGTPRNPASILLSDRKARNFTHLYIGGGRAGLEQAGLREYQNIASP